MKLLKRCLASLELTTYQNFSVFIIDNESDDPATLDLLQETEHRVLGVPHKKNKFNFSYLVNKGVEESSSKYVLLLNDDTEVLAPCWLSQMVGYLSIDGVGVVGAKLLFRMEEFSMQVSLTAYLTDFQHLRFAVAMVRMQVTSII